MSIILITGGTGFLGQQVVPILLSDPQVDRIRILSRNEHVQADLREVWHESHKVDLFIGDVRDFRRVRRAAEGCHEVYHFAAAKRVESSEYNPGEAVETNVLGSQNVVDAVLQSDTVEKAIFTSTDKAVEPLNVYGITKALAEKMWIQANIGKHRAKFSACRYGNVWGSHGSVIERWDRQIGRGEKITVIDGGMTRFFITPIQAAQFVFSSMKMMQGAEVFIPKMRSIEITKLAEWHHWGRDRELWNVIQPRPGEKIHEKLVADAEVGLVTDVGDRLVRWPEFNLFPVQKRGDPIDKIYSSETAERWTKEEIECLLRS